MKPKINPGLPCSNLNLKLPIDPPTQNVHRHLLNHELSNDPPTQSCTDIFWVLDIKIPTAPESDPQVHRKVSAIADMLHTFCCAKCGLGSFGCDGIKNGYTKQAEKRLMRNGLLQQHFFFFFLLLEEHLPRKRTLRETRNDDPAADASRRFLLLADLLWLSRPPATSPKRSYSTSSSAPPRRWTPPDTTCYRKSTS